MTYDIIESLLTRPMGIINTRQYNIQHEIGWDKLIQGFWTVEWNHIAVTLSPSIKEPEVLGNLIISMWELCKEEEPVEYCNKTQRSKYQV